MLRPMPGGIRYLLKDQVFGGGFMGYLVILLVMLARTYQQTFPSRVNTEFIGMASQFSRHKQRRKTEETRKQSLESNFLYTEHQEKQLSRTICSKSVELNRLQSSRLRKLEQIKEKEELSELRQYQLEQMRSRNAKLREENKRKLEMARTRVVTLNQEGRAQLKLTLHHQTQSLKQRIEDKLKFKAKQASLIREMESRGLQMVDSFHRRKNSENLQAYLQRIKQENRMKKQHETRAKSISKELSRMNKSVTLKKNYLNCLDEEISKYKTDTRVYNRSRLFRKDSKEEDCSRDFGKDPFSSLYKQQAH